MYKCHVMQKKHCYDCDKRISLKTTSSPSIFFSLMRTFIEFCETPLDKATYN